MYSNEDEDELKNELIWINLMFYRLKWKLDIKFIEWDERQPSDNWLKPFKVLNSDFWNIIIVYELQ